MICADVVQCTFVSLQSDVMREVLSPYDMFAAILAAAAHDIEHPVRYMAHGTHLSSETKRCDSIV